MASAAASTEPDLVSSTMMALLSGSKIDGLLNKFSSPLKTNFENRSLWLRLGLTFALSNEHNNALQAFNECLRIDQDDPLPAMLAAKLLLEDDPESGLELVDTAIERCKRSEAKNIAPLLSKCYLLSSIMHAHIYEREPESIKQFKTSHLKASLHNLDLATEAYSDDYLVHFHRALHEAKQKSYQTAIDNLRRAIRLNPHHVPSMQLLILTLTGLKLHDEALVLCESTLHEFEDNLLLLYIKCNLEQCLAEARGFKSALNTAQHILKCIRRSASDTESASAETKKSSSLFSEDWTKCELRGPDFLSGELSVWLLVAEIFIKLGSTNDAELCVNEGSTYANGALSHQIMFTRGLIAKAKNNLIEAKSFFQSCLALRPRHASALQQIAHVHHLLGNHPIAEKFLKDSLDADSECHLTWKYLSQVFIETNQHDKATECVKKATLLEESSPVIPISVISRLILE